MSELGKTYGAAYIGVCTSAVLYGITNLQLFVYFREYRHDNPWNKLVVCWLWVLDSLHLALCIHMLYWYLVMNYGNSLELLEVQWSFQAETIMTAIIVVCVHTLYTIRVWYLEATVRERNSWHRFRPISVVITLALCAGMAAALVLCYYIVRAKRLLSVLHSSELWKITYYPLATAAFVDTLIAVALCYLLSRCRTGFQRTDTVITWLMFYTFNTGMVTTACTLTAIIVLAVFPVTLYFVTLEFVMVKLYINSYLAMLNARSSLLHAKDYAPEPVIQPVCIVCRSSPAGAAQLRRGHHMPMTGSSKMGSYPEVDGVGSVAKIDFSMSGMEDTDPPVDTVALHPLHPSGWLAPDESRHDKAS